MLRIRLGVALLWFTFHAPLGPAQEPPEAVRAWLAAAATPLATFAPGQPLDDLEPLRKIVGGARIVAIGEATHGSSEFFAFKQRALEFLVRELGFTDFALESDWATALAANEWLVDGKGDVQAALAALSPLWQTEEYRTLLEWLQAWNSAPGRARKVRLHGLDLQSGVPCARFVRAYLERVEPALAEDVGPLLEKAGGAPVLPGNSAGGPTPMGAELDGVIALFDELREPFVAASSEPEWALARQHAVVLRQAYTQRYEKRGNEALAWRDRCMADNARWILGQAADTKLVLSAHNGHVSRDGLNRVEGYGRITSIGLALAEDARASAAEDLSLVVLGCAFARGGFRAYPAGGGGLAAFRIDSPDPAGIEAQLLAAGLGNALIDLSAAPADGPVRAWLDQPRPMLGIGGLYDPSAHAAGEDLRLTTLPAEYDALLFVAETTAARPVGLR
jgi:erythromycin esterase